MDSDSPADFLSSVVSFFRMVWDSASGVISSASLKYDLAAVLGAFVLAFVLSLILKPLCKRMAEVVGQRERWVDVLVSWLSGNLFRLLLVCLLWSASLALDSRGLPLEASGEASNSEVGIVDAELDGELEEGSGAVVFVKGEFIVVRAFASLATLLLFSRALPIRLRKTPYFRVMFLALAVGLALNLVGLWVPVRDGLNEIKLLPVNESTETRVTVLSLFKGIFAVLLLIPFCRWLLRLLDHRVERMETVSPVLRVLISKFLTILVVAIAVLFGVSSLGINLSALAVLGGAIGLGLGFGFQKVVSNLISGVILLTDRSIKPGDVIEVDNTYGWINKLSARYVSVVTRDGTEHLIPNETLITEKVTNWSFSNDEVRVRVPFGASYNADPRLVMRLAVEAGKTSARVIADKEPVCWILGYGDSAIDYELRVWIRDPAKGIGNLRSEIYLGIWDAFKENGIEIPFPQRDLHIRSSVPAPFGEKEE